MKRIFALFLAISALGCAIFSAVSCDTPNESATPSETLKDTAKNATEAPTEKETKEKYTVNNDTRPELNVLFIGNSYTYYHDMPSTYFFTLAAKAGYRVRATAITKGGYTLERFADPDDEYGKKVAEALDEKNAGKYDYVILQEQSKRPALDDGRPKFFEAVSILCEKIRAIGAEPILYSTWGRKVGSDELDAEGWTNESMTWRLAAAYSAIGEKLGIKVAHVGLAFFDVNTNSPDVELYESDKSHSSALGSYLAAATILAKMLGVDPRALNYNAGFEGEIQALLNEAAYIAATTTPQIPEEYAVAD